MDKAKATGKTLREEALRSVEETDFYPGWGKNRLRAMIATRPDWCLSRQRFWNVPHPLPSSTNKAANCTQKRRNSWKPSPAALKRKESKRGSKAPKKTGCPTTKNTKKSPTHLMSGSTPASPHQAVLNWSGDDDDSRPDMYLEGSDQHRGWFHSSLLTGAAMFGRAPYRQILTHGFVVAGDGRKMSKSRRQCHIAKKPD